MYTLNNKSAVMLGSTFLGILALLLTVIIGETHFHSFHNHDHYECSPEDELDPCHRHLVHNDHVAGCDHDSHFQITDSGEYFIVGIFPRSLDIIPDLNLEPKSSVSTVDSWYIQESLSPINRDNTYLRGPPAT